MSIAETLNPPKRGELEITDVSRVCLERGELRVERLAGNYGASSSGQYLRSILRERVPASP